MSLKEVLWGTPREILADQRYGQLSRMSQRRKLNPAQEAELVETRGLSLRLFLRRGLTVVGGTAAVASPIGGYLLTHSELFQFGSTPEVQPQQDPAKEYVIQAITELPSSAFKDVLVSRIEPLLKIPAPKSIDIAGIPIPVYGVGVRVQTISGNKVRGRVHPRPDMRTTPTIELTQDQDIFLPYIDLAKPEEMDRFRISPDGIPFIIFEGKKGTKFNEGIKPEIIIETPDTRSRNPIDRDAIAKITKFTAVKEASSLLLYLLQVEAMMQELQKLGINPQVEVKREDGSIGVAEIVNTNMDILHREFGRYVATNDIGGEVIAIHASKGMPVIQDMARYDSSFARFHTAISEIDLGTTPQEMRRNAIRVAMTTPNIPKFYTGDLNKTP